MLTFVKFKTAALAAPVWDMSGNPRHMSAIMFTIEPPWSLNHWLYADLDKFKMKHSNIMI